MGTGPPVFGARAPGQGKLLRMNRMKVMINVPRGRHGGVANYYAGLRNKFRENILYNYTGGRRNSWLFPFAMLADYVVFVFKLIRHRPDIVHVNPSLDVTSTFREAGFLLLAKVFRRKVIVFWRGWEPAVADRITARHSGLFRAVFGRADAFIVLAGDFAAVLRGWGIERAIHLETTQVDDDLLRKFRIEEKSYDTRRLIFMARIEKDKGIYETMNAVRDLAGRNIELVVAGSGPELENARAYAVRNGVDNVTFTGYLFGEDKVDALATADVFIFPTYYGEGMPNCVLEAMAFGLPVITRPVGGLKDFFEDGKMGHMTESMDHRVYVELISGLLDDPGRMRSIGEYNYRYARGRFWASRVAERLEEIYRETHGST